MSEKINFIIKAEKAHIKIVVSLKVPFDNFIGRTANYKVYTDELLERILAKEEQLKNGKNYENT